MFRERDSRRRPRTAPDVKKERQKRLADALAAQELETRRVDICKSPATASTNKPPGDLPSGGRSTARKVFGFLGDAFDFLEVFRYPIRGVWEGKNSFEIREEDSARDYEDFQQRGMIISPFGGMIGPNPLFPGPT